MAIHKTTSPPIPRPLRSFGLFNWSKRVTDFPFCYPTQPFRPDEDNAADLGACSPLKVALANFLNLAVNIAAPEETLAMDHLPLSQDSTS